MTVNAAGVDAEIAEQRESPARGPLRVALLGNPNTGKTTLFNRLSGPRHKTSNFPGTTLEARLGRIWLTDKPSGTRSAACCGTDSIEEAWHADFPGDFIELVDLPGVYSLELDQLESRISRETIEGITAPKGCERRVPESICVVVDATNLVRNLMLAGEALRRRLPTVVAVNMIDIARRQGLSIDAAELGKALGCRVVLTSARTGEGLDELRAALGQATIPTRTPPGDAAGLRKWAEEAYAQAGELSGVDT